MLAGSSTSRLAAASVAIAVLGSTIGFAAAGEASGTGATFPQPVYQHWAAAFRRETADVVSYTGTGSGNGIQSVKAGSVTFGASDMPLDAAALAADGLVEFPTVIGGVLPVANLAGVDPGSLVLDGPTLAAIFLGTIGRWNAPEIVALNPKIPLPDLPVAIVHRSDASGTTFVFTDYLSKASASWAAAAGAGTTVAWPRGTGAVGNEGVAAAVAAMPGAIGYVGYDYAQEHVLTYFDLVNPAGRVVQPTLASFAAAAVSAGPGWAVAPGFAVSLTAEPGGGAWPITSATFVLMRRTAPDPDAARTALRFFAWSYHKGGAIAEDLSFVPLPASVVEAIEKSWSGLSYGRF